LLVLQPSPKLGAAQRNQMARTVSETMISIRLNPPAGASHQQSPPFFATQQLVLGNVQLPARETVSSHWLWLLDRVRPTTLGVGADG